MSTVQRHHKNHRKRGFGVPKVVTLGLAETRPELMGYWNVWFLKTSLVEEWGVKLDWRLQRIMNLACQSRDSRQVPISWVVREVCVLAYVAHRGVCIRTSKSTVDEGSQLFLISWPFGTTLHGLHRLYTSTQPFGRTGRGRGYPRLRDRCDVLSHVVHQRLGVRSAIP